MPKKLVVLDILEEDARDELQNLPPEGARCRDCGKAVQPWVNGKPDFKRWDAYIVRDEVWAEARMGRKWFSGYLCTPCLTKRLGRKPIRDRELLAWIHSATKTKLRMHATKEYVDRLRSGRGY